jgi:gentisate 1,2-dioxygenase
MKVAARKTPEREAFYARIREDNLSPLWEVFATLITPQPRSGCRPHLWRYAHLRTLLMEAGELISAEEAERRVLILENPGMPGQARITTSLYAGLQLVLPGEVAPAHRHTQSALRFVLEGKGAHTSVNGERTAMHRGDFVITPNWGWHDHGNETDAPIIWLDGLDIPLVQFLDASFAEGFGGQAQPIMRPQGDSMARFGEGLMPVDHRPGMLASPLFNYPYARSRAALDLLSRTGEWHPRHGLKMRYVNPVDGGWAIPTIGTHIQLLPKGFATLPYRATDATVFCCVEGSGSSTIDGVTFTWGPSDIFVVPSWATVTHKAIGESVLFSLSDRPVHEKLGLWREQELEA